MIGFRLPGAAAMLVLAPGTFWRTTPPGTAGIPPANRPWWRSSPPLASMSLASWNTPANITKPENLFRFIFVDYGPPVLRAAGTGAAAYSGGHRGRYDAGRRRWRDSVPAVAVRCRGPSKAGPAPGAGNNPGTGVDLKTEQEQSRPGVRRLWELGAVQLSHLPYLRAATRGGLRIDNARATVCRAPWGRLVGIGSPRTEKTFIVI